MKVGILTHYFKSLNYGGNLQAYALCSYINSLGIDAEQIRYDMISNGNRKLINRLRGKNLSKVVYVISKKIKYNIKRLFNNIFYNSDVRYRNSFLKLCKNSFIKFNTITIKNSNFEYNNETINKTNELYDSFITGSDQVWNFSMFKEAFFLNFVNSGKKKLSYAASVVDYSLSDQQIEYFKKSIESFDAISVRENSAVEYISSFSSKNVNLVVDPTLLLSKNDWNNIAAERLIKEKYIFSYFLGNNKISRKTCEKFAKENNLIIVDIPVANDGFKFLFKDFGDKTYVASPEEFLSLIKNAEYVFTDSFHAVVFSYIFNKQFFAFKREENDYMSSRIVDLLKLIHAENRYCDTIDKCNLDYLYIISSSSCNSVVHTKEMDELIKISKDFLMRNLI